MIKNPSNRGPVIVLSAKELQALQLYAWANGRCWKRALSDEWQRACANVPMESDGLEMRALLQGLRNAPFFGPSGLRKFRLPAGFTFKRSF